MDWFEVLSLDFDCGTAEIVEVDDDIRRAILAVGYVAGESCKFAEADTYHIALLELFGGEDDCRIRVVESEAQTLYLVFGNGCLMPCAGNAHEIGYERQAFEAFCIFGCAADEDYHGNYYVVDELTAVAPLMPLFLCGYISLET